MFFSKLRWALLGLLGILLFGTLGYRAIEGWETLDALWMVVITLTTIGYGEVHPLTTEGRVFTLLVILCGAGLVTYTFGQLTRYVVEGGLAEDIRARRRRRRMEQLHNHFIVIGFGRLGREVAADLHHKGHTVLVVDPKIDALAGAPDPLLCIAGDGTSDAVLLQAGLSVAAGIAIATPHSATNVYITLAARQLAPDVAIVTRVDDEEAADKARRAGADTIVRPFGIGGNRMAQSLLHPDSAQFVDHAITRHHGDLDLEDVRIGSSPNFHGTLKTLELRRRYGVLVVAMRRPDGALVTAPDPDAEIHEGSVLVVVGRPERVAAFHQAAE